MAMVICISSLVMLGKKEIPRESLDYMGENINGKIILSTLNDGYEIQFFPNKTIRSQHSSSDAYTFNFYNNRNDVVLNSGLVVFIPNIKESFSTKLLGIENKKLEISRVTIRTKNAEYNIEMKEKNTD